MVLLFVTRPFVRDNVVTAFTRIVARAVLFIFGFLYIEETITSQGENKIQPKIIVSNHVSVIEIVYFMSTRNCPCFVMKKSCSKIPLVGYIATVLGGVVVEHKENGKGASTAIVHTIKNHSRPIVVFPEGTTSNGSCILPFRTGAFLTDAPMLPVFVDFPLRSPTQFSCAYESISTPVYICRLLSGLYHPMKVTYLPIYQPSIIELKDPKLYAENVRKTISKYSHLPLSSQTYQDKLLFHEELRQLYGKLGPYSHFLYVRPEKV